MPGPTFVAGVLAASLVVLAQQQQTLENMSCADYLKARSGSAWSDGYTGASAIDQGNKDQLEKVAEFCRSNPNEPASKALEQQGQKTK